MGLFAERKLADLVALLSDQSIASELHPYHRNCLLRRFSRLTAGNINSAVLIDALRGAFRAIGDDGYFPQPPETDFIMQWMLRLYDELTSESSD